MDLLYKKSEIVFSILWIAIYVVSLSVAESFVAEDMFSKMLPSITSGILTIIIVAWLNKDKMFEKY